MWNVDIPTRDELLDLAELREPAVVSIYLPTTPVTMNAQADRIALKTAAAKALVRLQQNSDLKAHVVDEIDEELADLIDDDNFWERQAHGLAVFATAEHLIVFRMPHQVTAQVHVTDRAYIKPLLSVTSHPVACFVLALAEGAVRLIEVPADMPPTTIRVKELPRSAAAAAGKTSIGGRSHSGRLVGSEGKRTHIRHYARQVDAALRPILAGSDIPLVLAAVDPVRSIYRTINSYPHLVQPVIEMNPDRATDQELARAARGVLEQTFTQSMERLRELFDERRGQRRVVTDVAEAARAATAGAIDTLVIDRDFVLAGSVEVDGTVRLDDGQDQGAYGVIDEIARRVLLTGGVVLSVNAEEVPEGQALAAILRYPI